LMLVIMLLLRLKNRHEHLFKELGSPSILGHAGLKDLVAMYFFLKERRFSTVEDFPLSMVCYAIKAWFWLFLCMFILGLVCVIP
jgi:hypothetical protein